VIRTCPVCRLAVDSGPLHMRCRCPAEGDDLDRRLNALLPRSASSPPLKGPFAIAHVSRAALASIGAENFARGAVVEFLSEGGGPAATLAAILNEAYPGPAELAFTEAQCAEAMARHPAPLPEASPPAAPRRFAERRIVEVSPVNRGQWRP
jgi:hypothetical protein